MKKQLSLIRVARTMLGNGLRALETPVCTARSMPHRPHELYNEKNGETGTTKTIDTYIQKFEEVYVP